MLTLRTPGVGGPYCDGIDRRTFLRIGALGMGGLTLPGLLAAEAASPAPGGPRTRGGRHKSVIMVYLSGGLSHHDTFDMKLKAPKEIRGEFEPIATRIPGISVSEHLPKIAAILDKVAVLRAVTGLRDEHSSFQNLTGYPMALAQRDGKPNFGSVIARAQGPVDPRVPPFVDLFPIMQHKPYNSSGAGLLGQAYNPVKVNSEDLAIMRHEVVPPDRSRSRHDLLAQFDQIRRSLDSAPLESMDASYRNAFSVLSTSRVAQAMDLTREDPRLRDRYGHGSARHLGDGAPMWNDQLLIARRLVEAGVRCVTVAYGFWDTHGNNFGHLRKHLPLFDTGISALIEDLHARGLEQDVTVVVWGEFGRTPKINKDAGRDHWAPVSSALLAGGGMKVGQVLGATDAQGAYAVSGQTHYLDVLATIYHNLGLDPHSFIPDKSGRPMPLLPGSARPIDRLV